MGTDSSDCGVRTDEDGDGFAPYEASALDPTGVRGCDDSDPGISPDAPDVCDGIDNDCDGIRDELTDTIEPNDLGHPYYLNTLDEEGDTVSVDSYRTHESDEDAFWFYLLDHTDYFVDDDNFMCTLTPPAGMDIWVAVYYEGDHSFTGDFGGAGVPETVAYSSTLGSEDAGVYTLRIGGSGGSCDSPVNISCTKLAG